MKRRKVVLNICILVLLILGSILGVFSLAFGQGGETEPNNTCQTAQALGAAGLPFSLAGSLDTPPEEPDVDFFRFTSTPGTAVQVDLEGQATGQGTLLDPFLGLFDSNCNVLALNDDSGGTLNSRLHFAVPADGIFILAATSCCDDDFSGDGGSSGSYQLTLSAIAFAGSISGRVVDAQLGTPLPGDSEPFAFVQLFRCNNGDCSEFVNSQLTDSEGRFHFDSDINETPLVAGTYQVTAFANQYQPNQTEPFEVGEGEDVDVGDIPLMPLPLQISEIQPCESLPSAGGTCHYSVTITNRLLTRFRGATWSNVFGTGIGSLIDFTQFPAGKPRKVNLGSQKSITVHFEFQVPGTVADGASICADVFVGQGSNPFFNTVNATFVFCITKGPGGEFTVLPEQEAREVWQRLHGEAPAPASTKGKGE